MRQRDPLSNYLFLLAMEYLSNLTQVLKKGFLVARKEFKFHPRCENLQHINLYFEDFEVIFGL